MTATSALRQVSADSGPWPLHDAAASRAVEAAALQGAAPHALMEAAGLAVARLAIARFAGAHRIRVLAGPGNNGGDGLVAARWLHGAGKAVDVVLCGDAAHMPADAAAALSRAQGAGVAIAPAGAAADASRHTDLVIDALFGLGARRGVDAPGDCSTDRAATQRTPVLSIDLPSGLCADTGRALGGAAVRATATVSLLTLKPGCFTGDGRAHAGEVWFAPLLSDTGCVAPTAWLAGPPAAAERHASAHKGRFGDVAVVGGAPGMTGAAWLAARAALAAGAGRVFCSLLDPGALQCDPMRPELMIRSAWWLEAPPTLQHATVVVGCGGGTVVRDALPFLISHAGRLVVDADALNAIAHDDALRRLLQARGRRGRPSLLTPHPLEAARLLGTTVDVVQGHRLQAAQQLADAFAAAVLLKGSGSITAAPGVPPQLNPTGNAWLASAGTGDVLAGWAGGCWAQRPAASGSDIAAAAAWQHGAAADRHAAAGARTPLRAADLVEALARG